MGTHTGKVFGNLEEIVGMNTTFLAGLEAAFVGWGDESRLGASFLKFAPFFKIYTGYSNGFEAGARLIVGTPPFKMVPLTLN